VVRTTTEGFADQHGCLEQAKRPWIVTASWDSFVCRFAGNYTTRASSRSAPYLNAVGLKCSEVHRNNRARSNVASRNRPVPLKHK
jgi:hypothetical protein